MFIHNCHKQGHGKPEQPGCLRKHKAFFILGPGKEFFIKPTWLTFIPIYEARFGMVSTRKVEAHLSDIKIKEALDCIKDSCEDEIEGWKIDIIFPPIDRAKQALMEKLNSRRMK